MFLYDKRDWRWASFRTIIDLAGLIPLAEIVSEYGTDKIKRIGKPLRERMF